VLGVGVAEGKILGLFTQARERLYTLTHLSRESRYGTRSQVKPLPKGNGILGTAAASKPCRGKKGRLKNEKTEVSWLYELQTILGKLCLLELRLNTTHSNENRQREGLGGLFYFYCNGNTGERENPIGGKKSGIRVKGNPGNTQTTKRKRDECKKCRRVGKASNGNSKRFRDPYGTTGRFGEEGNSREKTGEVSVVVRTIKRGKRSRQGGRHLSSE